MIDYADLYGGLKDLHNSLESILDDTAALAADYATLEDALPAIQELIDDTKRRMEAILPKLAKQKQQDADDDRRAYFKAIGPL